MAYENSGRLFRNEYKSKESQPDYKGDFTDENGKKWDLAAWIKNNGRGDWLSVKVSPKREKQEKPQTEAKTEELDDKIPF